MSHLVPLCKGGHNLKTILPKKDIDLLNKSFEKSDNETVISLLENILKDFDAK